MRAFWSLLYHTTHYTPVGGEFINPTHTTHHTLHTTHLLVENSLLFHFLLVSPMIRMISVHVWDEADRKTESLQ
jgi:hypothetical protein